MSALLTIIIPVKNGAKYLHTCFNSIRNQSFQDYMIIISDNSSSDSTSKICIEEEKNNTKIKYFRQEKDLGIEGNLKFLFSTITTKYVTIWAVDDFRSFKSLEENINLLEIDESVIGATSRWLFENQNESLISASLKDFNQDKPLERVNHLSSIIWLTSGFSFSIFRSELLQKYKPPFHNGYFYGNDVCRLAFLLMHGKIKITDGQGRIILGINGESNSHSPFKELRKTYIEYVFPLFYISKYLLSIYWICKEKENITSIKVILKNIVIHNFYAVKISLYRIILLFFKKKDH